MVGARAPQASPEAWLTFARAALAALGTLTAMERSRARDHLNMPALRVARALGILAIVRRHGLGQDQREHLVDEAHEALARFASASTPAQRAEAVAALRALEARMRAESQRLDRIAQRQPDQRPLAERLRAALRTATELTTEAMRSVNAVTSTALSPGGDTLFGLSAGAALALGAVLALLLWRK